MNETVKESCDQAFCFFCSMAEPDRSLRRTSLAKCFEEMPERGNHGHVLVLSSLWSIAMRHPNDPEFPSLGVFSCMSKLILRGLNDEEWLLRDQNMYIPYYAAHIIGSYTLNSPEFAQKAAESGVIPPLLELLEGKLTWVETRVAVRALGHLASHKSTFSALIEYEEEIVNSAMKTALTCLELVYSEFVIKKGTQRLAYHCDLMTRGVGGLDLENRKAEEWASQIQCWSLALLDRFARNQRCLNSICNPGFLKELGRMWGGLVNINSPAGVGLIRTLCKTKVGRVSVSDSKEAVESLCNTSRSSDDWQIMAVESLLLILKDTDSRYKAIDTAALYLSDLVEMRRKKAGEAITQILLQDYSKIKYGQLSLKSKRAEKALEQVWDLKVDRRKREKLMSEEEIIERKALSSNMKKQGNRMFWAGDVGGAKLKYSKALDYCPLRYRKERIVLYSNRAQCCLALQDPDPEGAISDTTRALCLCLCRRGGLHGKSLWRRSQAYDIRGMNKESLLDCLLFLNVYEDVGIPCPVTRMISKQMKAASIFSQVADESVEQDFDFEERWIVAKRSSKRKRRKFKSIRTRS